MSKKKTHEESRHDKEWLKAHIHPLDKITPALWQIEAMKARKRFEREMKKALR